MLMNLSSSLSGKNKSTPYANGRTSSSPDYRSESSSTSPLHMTNLDNSNRVGGSMGNVGGAIVNGHDVTTLTSSAARSGHYTHNNNNNIIKETMINNSSLSTSNSVTTHRNNVNSIYSHDHGGLNTIPYSNSSRRVPDVHTSMDTYENSTDYKLLGSATNSENCHELKKWSDVSSVDKITMPPKNNGGRSDQDTKINGLDNTKRRSNCSCLLYTSPSPRDS